MSRKPPRSSGAHRGAARVLDILEFLPGHRDGFTLAEISRALAVPKSSALALLRTLVERGYLVLESGLYRAGGRAHGLGPRSGFHRELPAVARPALLDLAQKTAESVYLAVLTRQPPEVVYVDKVESRQSIRYSAELGERRPLYCTAPGLAVFAFLPAADRTRLLATLKLVAFTESTVTSRDAIRVRLDEVRRSGVVVNVDEFMAGASGIAAPILDAEGVAVGACTVIGPTPRLLAQEKELVRHVRAAGEAISRALAAR